MRRYILFPMIFMSLYSASDFAFAAGAEYEGPWYDYTAYTECMHHPEPPLYHGGIIKDGTAGFQKMETGSLSPAFVLFNLTAVTRYSFSCWLKINRGADSALLRAKLTSGDKTLNCIGTSVAKRGCWSFLKGGFVLDAPSETSVIFFQNDDESKAIEISVASAALQPFSVEQWEIQQNASIRTKRKRAVAIHVSDAEGNRVGGASVSAQQISKDFPFGSAIAKTILGNSKYQAWFVDRFNAAVFENELKWYATEPEPNRLNYTLADQLLQFIRSNQILARGHNIFWEDPKYTPAWLRNLSSSDFRSAVSSRILSLLTKYKGDFVHWDVSNELLHFDFYERRLMNPNASLDFFVEAQRADPLVRVFMNDFNVVEGCEDGKSTVDAYVGRMRELERGGVVMGGVGLEGHFGKPNVALMRGVLDKLATLGLPIWLTEVDISSRFDRQTQAKYLEEVLREGFSYPWVNGIILWTALHPNQSCYQMCLTDDDFQNLPAGEVVDRLLSEWRTKEAAGETDDHGLFSFDGFLGGYKVAVRYGNRSVETTFFLSRGDETEHFNIQL
ncbi:endo-1,4-beta-xylanase 5-like [Dendrobium catenatum]|uniref:GH10 domain-containing protein n=1 Tax=Dendrobium catenatum TaxID=906689 RepID=A0A2I0VVD5_9ASPA|nr:endo-1,4-beta-xylanase 5-like [Dendrobium catenatum]PKU67364.1 hypothetical protein MA16_Dca016422 [Dendrobium catenatum]